MSVKTLIHAFFLSQSLIQGISASAELLTMDARPVSTIHIYRAPDVAVVVPDDGWGADAQPVPYYEYWDNGTGQTAQQYIAIVSTLNQDLDDLFERWPRQ